MGLNPAGDKLRRLVYQIAGEENSGIVTVALGWRLIVGSLLADRTSIQKLEKGTLFVSVSNNVWMQELILRKYQILSEVRARLQIELKEIVFILSNER